MKQATGMLLLLQCAAVLSGIVSLVLLGNAMWVGALIFGMFCAALLQNCEHLHIKQEETRKMMRRQRRTQGAPLLQVKKGGSTAA